jgi:hypothetical protein
MDRRPLDEIEAGQACFQLLCQFGMPGQELAARGGSAGLDAFQVLLQDLGEERIVFRGGSDKFGHRRASINGRKRVRARAQSTRTAPLVRCKEPPSASLSSARNLHHSRAHRFCLILRARTLNFPWFSA